MRRWLLPVELCVALAACGGATPPASGPSGPKELTVDNAAPKPGSELLAGVAGHAQRLGAGPLRLLEAAALSDGGRIGAFVDVPADRCGLFYAMGTEGVHDVDVLSFGDDGSPLVTDESPARNASIILCPPHPTRVYVSARVVSGAGFVALGAQEVAPENADLLGDAFSARGAGDPTGRLSSWPGLERLIAEHRRELGGTWEDVRRVAIPVDPRTTSRVSVEIGADRCLDVFVAPSDEVMSFDLLAEDDAGRVVARARNLGRNRSFVLCSATAMPISLALRPRASQGLAAVVVGRSEVNAQAEINAGRLLFRSSAMEPLSQATLARKGQLEQAGFEIARTSTKGEARVGRAASSELELAAGCSLVDITAGSPLGAVRASLWGPDGEALGDAAGAVGSSLLRCGPAGPVWLDVEALARPGPFGVQVWQVPADGVAPLLTKQPRAAGRLWDRLSQTSAPSLPPPQGQLEAIDLTPLRRQEVLVDVPASSCVDVIVAIGDGGTGLELAVIDEDGSRLHRGAHVVSARVCAAQQPETAATFVSLSAGKARALVARVPVVD